MTRSLSLEDLQEVSSGEVLDTGQWQRRTGLLPLSFQNPVYHMTTTSPRQQPEATPSDGSAGSQGNAEDRSAVAAKPAFLTQMSVGLGGGERGERMSSSSSGEEYSRRALSLSDTPGKHAHALACHRALPPSLYYHSCCPASQETPPPCGQTHPARRGASTSLRPPAPPRQDPPAVARLQTS